MGSAVARTRLNASLTPGQLRLTRHFVGIAAFMLFWQAIGSTLGAGLLAPPSEVLPEFFAMWGDERLPGIIAGSLQQLLLGYAFACAVGMP